MGTLPGMEWEPAWFARWPHTWDGGPHDWRVTERTARSRLEEAADLFTAWSDGGVPHTVLTLRSNGTGTLVHGPLPGRRPAYRLGFGADGRRELAVLPGWGSRDPYVLHETWSRHGAVASRHTGDIRERLLSATPLPGPSDEQVARLREWDPVDTVRDLVAALPRWTAEAEGLPWSEHRSDARERGDAVLARLAAPARAEELLVPPARRGLFGRRRPAEDRHAMPLEVGSHDLERLLAGTGRPFRVERSDKSRVLTAPVADGDVLLAVLVKAHPGLKLAVTGLLVKHQGANAAWTAPRGDLTEHHAEALPGLLGLALEVFDGFVEEFQRPVEQALVPVDVPPAY